MNKTLTNLLRSAFVVVCILCGVAATYAQSEQVVAAGGAVSENFSCTIGEVCVAQNAGMWATAIAISSGIDGVYADGDVIVGNVANDKALNIQLSDAVLADGAYYNVYNLQGMLLESGKIDTNSHVLNYDHLLRGAIIVTINTSKAVIATYKLTK